MDFTHLHVHTPFSLLDGFCRIEKIVEKAKKLNMKNIAITDHGVMFGAIDFYKECIKNNINPIIGCELYVAKRTYKDKEPLDKENFHIVLLCKNNKGYENLIKLVSIAHIEGFYYKPRIDYELLKEYSEGLICLSACLKGEIQQKILSNNYEEAKDLAIKLNNIFGQDNFYLEMQDHGLREQKKVNIVLKEISKSTGIPLVVTNDCHYVEKNQHQIHDVLLCINTGKKLSDTDRMGFKTNEFYFKSQREMEEIFSNDDLEKEAIENTEKIANKCKVTFDFNNYHIPEYKVPQGFNSYSYVVYLCTKGVLERYKEKFKNLKDPENTIIEYIEKRNNNEEINIETLNLDDYELKILNRLSFEINTINKMGYLEYFLIVYDFINFVKNNNIIVGPGRGSAAGSIVSYCLKITEIDPLKYNLLFERFLNPERVSMPDIDIDFESRKREVVIDYVKEKYGKDHVSQIITFGKFKARLAIRDVARVMGISYGFADKIAKMIPNMLNITIDKALEINTNLRDLYNNDEKVKKLIDIAKEIEGIERHASTHAAGVVISKNPVDTYVPLYVNDGNIVTEYTMTTLEELGLLKMDFLGLNNLDIIKDTLENIKKNKGIDLDLLNLNKLNFEDEEVYKLISSGDTLGIFQLESAGMRKFMKELKPSCLEDIIAGISLYRPGPMDSIPTYIKNKENPELISYIDEKLKPILEVTYGIMIYQEQVMETVRKLAGYSYARADIVRRAMGKKKLDVMEKERQVFIYGDEKDNIAGCLKNGISLENANKIFDDMIDFAKYAFNKSHAAAYSVIGYLTAYLKCHYTLEFMAALMSNTIGNDDKILEYKMDLENLNIKLLPPNVNYSLEDFTVEGENIRFPLSNLKGIGIIPAREIAKERIKNGKYTSFIDLCQRIEPKYISKKVAEALIKSGALDDIITNRASIMAEYENILERVNSNKKSTIKGQIGFTFTGENSLSNFRTIKINEFSMDQILKMEKEVVGFYLSGNPLSKYKSKIQEYSSDSIEYLSTVKNEKENNKDVSLIGIITKVKIINTKKNNLMAFIEIEDLMKSIEVIVFPKIYERVSQILVQDNIVYLEGRLSIEDEDNNKILASEIINIEDEDSICNSNERFKMKTSNFNAKPSAVKKDITKVYVRVADFEKLDKSIVNPIVCENYTVKLYFYDNKTKKIFSKNDEYVNLNKETMEFLKNTFGENNVRTM